VDGASLLRVNTGKPSGCGSGIGRKERRDGSIGAGRSSNRAREVKFREGVAAGAGEYGGESGAVRPTLAADIWLPKTE
jgi:hypothetical protein